MHDLGICSKCKHERKYHNPINFAFHIQTGCHIRNCKCEAFAEDKQTKKEKTMKGTYTYCRCCKSIDEKGYRGKRCKWCGELLVINPLDKLIIDKKEKNIKKEKQT